MARPSHGWDLRITRDERVRGIQAHDELPRRKALSSMSGTVVVVTNIPRPYRRALFGTVRERLATEDLDLRVLYTSDPAKHVRRGSPAAVIADPEMESYVHGLSFRIGYDRVIAIPSDLGRALKHCQPVCVVTGGFGMDAVVTARWCSAKKVPRILWSGAWPGREGEIGRLSLTIRGRLVRGAQAFIAYGTAAAEYLTSLGADADRIFCAWNTVDLESIASAARVAADNRSELAEKYRLATRNLLYVGALVESKGVNELVSAALSMETRNSDWALHFVGAGPLREELETTVRTAGRGDHFRFHGLRPAEDVAELLGLTDGLLLATKREAWGLVINEAMACGVPVVASPLAGATRDLIVDGVTGYVVEPSDTRGLADIISRLVAGDPECEQVGRAGAQAVRDKASLEKTAGAFVSAIRCAMAGKRGG
jgi:glycosyltransferase involved in cell wall biosynthesis